MPRQPRYGGQRPAGSRRNSRRRRGRLPDDDQAAGLVRKFRQYLANRRFKAISFKASKEISEALKTNEVTHITGFFDTEDEELVEIQAWGAREVDPEVKQAHKDSKIVVWS